MKRSVFNPSTKKLIKFRKGIMENWCVVLCVVLGDCRARKEDHERLQNQLGVLYDRSISLIRAAGISETGPHSLADLEKIHTVLGAHFQINCYESTDPPVVSFGRNTAQYQINLFLGNDHCQLITNLDGFTRKGNSKVCQLCKRVATINHRCVESPCKLCKSPFCENTTDIKLQQNLVFCDACNFYFYSHQCLLAHQSREKVCTSRTRCSICFQVHKKAEECACAYCHICKETMPFDHLCFMRPDRPGKNRPSMRRAYADLETFRDTATGNQRPILFVLNGKHCGERVYWGTDCLEQFLSEAIQNDSPFVNTCFLMHNFKAFDGQFMLPAILNSKLDLKGGPLIRNQDILTVHLKANNICFRDSLLFVPGTPLSAFPKLFGLKSVSKGFYPHSLSCDGMQHNSEPFSEGGLRFPPQAYFDTKNMSSGTRESFLRWWETENADFLKDSSREADDAQHQQ